MKRIICAVLIAVLMSTSVSADWYDNGKTYRPSNFWAYVTEDRYVSEEYQTDFDDMEIRKQSGKEYPTPSVFRFSASCVEDAENKLKSALEYAPKTIVISFENAKDSKDFYERYRDWRENNNRIDAIVCAAWTQTGNLLSIARNGNSVVMTIERYSDGWLAYVDTSSVIKVYKNEGYSAKLLDFRDKIEKIVGTDSEKVWESARFLCEKVCYDSEEYKYLTGNNHRINNRASHTVRGAVEYGKAVCGGYTAAYQFAMACFGVPCFEVVIADGTRYHSYSKVLLNGEWINMDVSQMDTTPNKEKLFFGFADIGCLDWVSAIYGNGRINNG